LQKTPEDISQVNATDEAEIQVKPTIELGIPEKQEYLLLNGLQKTPEDISQVIATDDAHTIEQDPQIKKVEVAHTDTVTPVADETIITSGESVSQFLRAIGF
jgi:hypothetical protein